MKAFAIYMAAIAQKHPSMITELLAYQLTIIKASQQYDGLQWRAYDTHYRVAAAATGNRSWSKLDVDLYIYPLLYRPRESGQLLLHLRQFAAYRHKLPLRSRSQEGLRQVCLAALVRPVGSQATQVVEF